jgi:hypothetical protein
MLSPAARSTWLIARPPPLPQVDRVIRQELGAPAHQVFAEFEQHATAAASLAQVRGCRAAAAAAAALAARVLLPLGQGQLSCAPPAACRPLRTPATATRGCSLLTLPLPPHPLAQVHRAKLHSGREVAVKIQYPGLQGAANADLTTLRCGGPGWPGGPCCWQRRSAPSPAAAPSSVCAVQTLAGCRTRTRQ